MCQIHFVDFIHWFYQHYLHHVIKNEYATETTTTPQALIQERLRSVFGSTVCFCFDTSWHFKHLLCIAELNYFFGQTVDKPSYCITVR